MRSTTLLWILAFVQQGNAADVKFTPADRVELVNAVKMWCAEKPKALEKYGPIKKWNIGKVTDFSSLFRFKVKFGDNDDDDISDWDVSHVTDMGMAFYHTEDFNHDIGKWDVSNVVNMEEMFSHAHKFEVDISKWNTGKVTDMSHMFAHAHAFNHPIGNWDTSKVTNMDAMFYSAHTFDKDISKWDTSKVTNMARMFYDAKHFHQDIGKWDVSKVTVMDEMFHAAYSMNYTDILDKWNFKSLVGEKPHMEGDHAYSHEHGADHIHNKGYKSASHHESHKKTGEGSDYQKYHQASEDRQKKIYHDEM